jgi:hypothetical protein
MKLSRLNRRDFIEGMLLLGLTACGGSRARGALQASRPSDTATGPFFDRIARLADQLARGTIDSDGFVHQAGARLMELELEQDVIEDWIAKGPNDDGVGRNGYRNIHRRELRFHGRPGKTSAILFYTPPGCANPPHEHHNLMSVKRVLKGSYHVRQFERLRRAEPGVIAIRQVSELTDVNFAGPYVDMTDHRLNVHWFGAGDEPVLALNINVESALRPADTFHGAQERREVGMYYIDPTATPDREGVILARTIEREQAAEFAGRRLAEFPSRLSAQPAATALQESGS